jgi:hypothetical protein
MITVFVNKEGYYVAGEGVEATLKCSPATDERGYPIFHELHHTYKVMFLALREVARKQSIQGDVIVYNDSRIIDELNGSIQPLDEICRKWQLAIRRELVPCIRSLVFFRKKTADFVDTKVATGKAMLAPADPAILGELAQRIETAQREQARTFKGRVLDRFKRMWKNE